VAKWSGRLERWVVKVFKKQSTNNVQCKSQTDLHLLKPHFLTIARGLTSAAPPFIGVVGICAVDGSAVIAGAELAQNRR
jgi:hypothetical protein